MARARIEHGSVPVTIGVPAGSGALTRWVIPLVSLLFACPAFSQGNPSDVYWHIDPNVKSCSMVIDPSLTQAQWETFVREGGATVSFKPLASAEPLGKRRFAVGIDYSITPIDQHDPAWINTFTHPDADCPLGDQIEMPALRARYGVSGTVDVVGFWTTAPDANYGLVGGAVNCALAKESERAPALAASASVTTLTGVPDFNLSVYGLGLAASKRFGKFAPYLGLKETLAVGTETTSKVDLSTESIPLTHGYLGVTGSVWKLGFAAEYNISAVSTFAFLVGFHL